MSCVVIDNFNLSSAFSLVLYAIFSILSLLTFMHHLGVVQIHDLNYIWHCQAPMFTLWLSIEFVSSVGHRSWNFRTLGILRGAKGIKRKEKILNTSKTCYVVIALLSLNT